MDDSEENEEVVVVLEAIFIQFRLFLLLCLWLYRRRRRLGRLTQRCTKRKYTMVDKIPDRNIFLENIITISDKTCIDLLRMSRNAFYRLTVILNELGGLQPTKNMTVSEQVAMFLKVLAHHTKNVDIKQGFKRSGSTVSIVVNKVVKAVLRCHRRFIGLPIPVDDDHCPSARWKWFEGCLGALDGTYIPMRVAQSDKARYRNRKGVVSVNVLAVCDVNMQYVYILTGWEGSAADSRVLKDAVARPNGLKVPRGNYYLCDSGYTNGDGFLAPYRGVRYHMREWDACRVQPANEKEFFNKTHAQARNVIERSFSLLKGRWAILRSNSFYPVKVANRIIMACCLLQNYISREHAVDPQEEINIRENVVDEIHNPDPIYIDVVEPSEQWTTWRDALAAEMFDDWRVHR